MKRIVCTNVDEKLFISAHECAAREQRPVADLIQDALQSYLDRDASRADAERSCKLFCSHRSGLALAEMNAILRDDINDRCTSSLGLTSSNLN